MKIMPRLYLLFVFSILALLKSTTGNDDEYNNLNIAAIKVEDQVRFDPEVDINHDSDDCEIRFDYFDKLLALNSFPGSGNTWVRSIIEKAFGYYTGSVYMDKKLYEGGFIGEYSQPFSGRTLMQKIHHNRRDKLSSSYFLHTENCVMLMRKPKEAILAEYKRTHASKEEKKGVQPADEAQPRLNSHVQDVDVDPVLFGRFFKQKYPQYVTDTLLFLEQCSENNHIMFFENLKEDAVLEMHKLSEFLLKLFNDENNPNPAQPGKTYSFPVREKCMLENLDGGFHRKSKSDDEKYKVYESLDWLDKKKFNNLMESSLFPEFFAKTGVEMPRDYLIEL